MCNVSNNTTYLTELRGLNTQIDIKFLAQNLEQSKSLISVRFLCHCENPVYWGFYSYKGIKRHFCSHLYSEITNKWLLLCVNKPCPGSEPGTEMSQ